MRSVTGSGLPTRTERGATTTKWSESWRWGGGVADTVCAETARMQQSTAARLGHLGRASPRDTLIVSEPRSERRQGAELSLDVRDRAVHEHRATRVTTPQDTEEADGRATGQTEDVG